jgi:hypothetical protein
MQNVNNNTSLNHETETKALRLLQQAGYSYPQEIDWLALSPKHAWMCLEVKYKSRLFHPPPFWGLGIDLAQAFLRRKLREELSLRTFLIVYFEDQVYGQFLDVLEGGTKYQTKKDILVFPVDVFIRGADAILEVLNGI